MSVFCMWRLRLTAGGGKGPVEPSGSLILFMSVRECAGSTVSL